MSAKGRASKPVRRAPRPKLYHGGKSGIRVGEFVLPASMLGELPPWYGPEYPANPARVYVTPIRDLAAYNAAACGELYGRGSLYEVEPDGPLEDDPDSVGTSFECVRARVVRIAQHGVTMTWRIRLANAAGIAWDDGGGPMYDRAGNMLPSGIMRAWGVTADDLVQFGFLPSLLDVQGPVLELLASRGVSMADLTQTRGAILASKQGPR